MQRFTSFSLSEDPADARTQIGEIAAIYMMRNPDKLRHLH